MNATRGSQVRESRPVLNDLARQIRSAERALATDRVGVLLVEQNAKEVLRIANRAYVLETGGVVLEALLLIRPATQMSSELTFADSAG